MPFSVYSTYLYIHLVNRRKQGRHALNKGSNFFNFLSYKALDIEQLRCKKDAAQTNKKRVMSTAGHRTHLLLHVFKNVLYVLGIGSLLLMTFISGRFLRNYKNYALMEINRYIQSATLVFIFA